jgi:integrase
MEDGLYSKTRSDRLTIVKQLFKWGHGKGKLLATNPLADEGIPPAESREQPCFSPPQVRVLLQQADPHEAAIFTVMAFAGLRVGEVRELDWADIDFSQGTHGWITVRRGGSNNTTK